MRTPLLTLPIILTLFVSGCTIPGIPCIPGLTCGQTVEEIHDVIVIETLQALPNNVPPQGTINLVAIVTNVADVDAEIKNVKDIHVELYDFCEGLFTIKENKGGKQTTSEKSVINIDLLRGEKKQVEWILEARDRSQVPVKTECNLKVLARYPYATKSITTLHLIDYTEMQRRISEGTYKEITSYRSIGYGPIKPYITVEGTQPIPVSENKINTVLSLQAKNRGKGFLTSKDGKPGETGHVIKPALFTLSALEQDPIANQIFKQLNTCKDKNFPKEGLKLIKGESTKIMCQITDAGGKVPVEATKTIQASIGQYDSQSNKFISSYWYEFRKEIKVTVEPKF
jgi:hypothetical protein